MGRWLSRLYLSYLGASLAFVGLGLSSRAAAQISIYPVEVTPVYYFDQTGATDGSAEIIVQLRNLRDTRFEAEIIVRDVNGQINPVTVPVDLDARQSRRVALPLTILWGTSVRYRSLGGDILGQSDVPTVANFDGYDYVLLGPQPIVRGVGVVAPFPSNGHTWLRAIQQLHPTRDPQTNAWELPTSRLGWQRIEGLLASATDFASLSDDQLAAIRAWVLDGGNVVISPQNPEQLRAPAIQALFGAFSATQAEGLIHMEGDSLIQTRYGARRALGRGQLHLLSRDVLGEVYPNESEMRGLLLQSLLFTEAPPRFEYQDLVMPQLQRIHGWLIALYWVIAIAYVILLGVVMSRAARTNPLRIVKLVPLIAIGAFFLFFVMGIGAAGTLNSRYVSAQITTLMPEQNIGTLESIYALSVGLQTRLSYESSINEQVVFPSGAETHLEGSRRFSSAVLPLLSQVSVRTQATAELPGRGLALEFTPTGQLSAVTNQLEVPLRSVLVIGDGQGIVLGDLAPGQRAEVDLSRATRSDWRQTLGLSNTDFSQGYAYYRTQPTDAILALLPEESPLAFERFASHKSLRWLHVPLIRTERASDEFPLLPAEAPTPTPLEPGAQPPETQP